MSLQLRHISTVGKKLLNSNTSSTCLHNMANFSPLTAHVSSGVLGTPANFNGFRVLAALLQQSGSGRQPNFAALNRGRHLYSAGRPSRWALAHILVYSCLVRVYHHYRLSISVSSDVMQMYSYLWPPDGIGLAIIFLPCGFFYLSSFFFFFHRLISAVADWMSTILPHMVWP